MTHLNNLGEICFPEEIPTEIPLGQVQNPTGDIIPDSHISEYAFLEPSVPTADAQTLMGPHQPVLQGQSPPGASLGRELRPRTDPSQPGPSSLRPDPPSKPRKKRIAEDGQYECPEPNCGNRYIRENDLKNHVRHHKYPYSCEICEDQFTSNKDLQRHRSSLKHSTNSGDEREGWTCPIESCPKRGHVYRKDNFKRHCEKKHPTVSLEHLGF